VALLGQGLLVERLQLRVSSASMRRTLSSARCSVSARPVVVLVDNHGRIAERFDGGTTGGTLAAALAYLRE
jgi:hypothetical protein